MHTDLHRVLECMASINNNMVYPMVCNRDAILLHQDCYIGKINLVRNIVLEENYITLWLRTSFDGTT